MADQFGDKTHEATPHRRQKAREQGQVARSQDLASALLLLLAALLGMLYLGNSLVTFMEQLCRRQFAGQAWLSMDPEFAVWQWRQLTRQTAGVVLPILGLMVVVAVLANLGQVGFLFLPDKLGFDASRISPLKGFERLFSMNNSVRLLFGLFKITVVTVVAGWNLWLQRDQIMSVTMMEVPQVAAFLVQITIWTALKVAAALVILALLDYGYQRWKHEQDLMMTTQEVREELKTLQGDPQVAARRRAVQRQLVLNRLSSTVPQADVVVTNPTHLAIAIRYDPATMEAPTVVAKGADHLAGRIRQLAEDHDIPIVERKPLARALYEQVEVGETVPAAQYAAIAEVLRYVYELKGRSLPTAS